MPKHESDATLTGDMRRAESLWQEMFVEMPVQDLQKFEHPKLRTGFPPVVWDVDDFRLSNRIRRCFHKGLAVAFQVLVLVSFFDI